MVNNYDAPLMTSKTIRVTKWQSLNMLHLITDGKSDTILKNYVIAFKKMLYNKA